MYNRSAKGIDSNTWKGLMNEISIEELETIIKTAEGNKAPGYDGITIDLLKLLLEDEGPLLEILTTLINVAFRSGASLPSWRKAVITMIPKKKEDGQWTEKVREMRPISVLQEFGKIASKILATRIGDRVLETPSVLNSAQRAFLKDGCIQQCINTALNVFEDFKDKKTKDKRLFVISYDQEKKGIRQCASV
jgi:hypothetical protein